MSSRTNPVYFGIEGQWVISLILSSEKDVYINSLEEFTIIEDTGNILPTWQISFVATSNLEKEWTESLRLPVIISDSINSPQKLSTILTLIRPVVREYHQGLKKYTATGALYAPAFTQTPYLTSVKSCNGTDILQSIAKKHFQKLDIENMTVSSGPQPWYQPNITDKKFADFVATHCYIPNSFVGTGITSDSTYIINDVVKLSNQEPKYSIGIGSSDPKVLPMYNYPRNMSNSGFINSVAGYGMDTPIYCLDTGVRTVHRPNIKFGFVKNKHAEIENVERRTLAPVVYCTNCSPEFHMAKANCDYGQALLSTETIEVTVVAPYFPIKIWDVVNLLYPDTEKTGGLNNNYSGKYLVSKVSRTITKNNLYTTLILNRDAHNMGVNN